MPLFNDEIPSFLWFLECLTRHQAPKPTLFIFADTGTPGQNQENDGNVFVNMRIICLTFKKLPYRLPFFMFGKNCKGAHWKMMNTGWITPPKPRIWISHRSKNLKTAVFYFQVREHPCIRPTWSHSLSEWPRSLALHILQENGKTQNT